MKKLKCIFHVYNFKLPVYFVDIGHGVQAVLLEDEQDEELLEKKKLHNEDRETRLRWVGGRKLSRGNGRKKVHPRR